MEVKIMYIKKNQLIHDDCLNTMQNIKDKSIDMILCDLPYGTTNCSWDSVIPLDILWEQYTRIAKDSCPIVLTAAQPFTSQLISSNFKLFKYSLVWEKSKSSGYLNAKRMPMRSHEDICVFYKKPSIYNPQMTIGEPYNKGKALRTTDVYGAQQAVLVKNEDGKRYPRSVIYFKTAESEGKVYHPTQKPISLFSYLIRTYSNKDDLILDNCVGVGTTAIAAYIEGRNYIAIEKEKKYYDIAEQRLKVAKATPNDIFS